MLRIAEKARVYVSLKPVDFRKAINGLAAMVVEEFESPANDSSVYVFYNRSRDKIKCLFWDKNGFVLYHKRLERGKFKIEKASTQLEAITQRVSGKGNITGITMMMFKLKPLYGDRFNDELCSADSKINVI